ncbi:hypothetical protein JCM10908_003270 [Rhodotorula pacifica]|uniref:uncharacterized protein n=1 Tax=Rhodotorula pacifica TaxID=1495444 RepID=UPI0031809A0D
MALQRGCSRVIAGTAYDDVTVTSLIPTITGTQTQVVNVPTTILSTYIGTIRGQVTQEVFTITGAVPGTTLIPASGYLTSLVVTSTPVSYIYSTVCPTSTTTSSSVLPTTTTTSTTTTTTPPPSSSSTTTSRTTTTTPPPTTSSSSSSTTTTTSSVPPTSTSFSTVTVPASRSSSSSSSTANPTALSNASNGKNNSSSSSNTGAIAGGVVGGVAALAILAGLGFWFFRRRSNKHERDFDPFSNDDPWNPAAADAGGARFSKADELAYGGGGGGGSGGGGGYEGAGYAGAGAGLAGAGAALGYGAAHSRSRSDASHEKGDPYYAPVATAGSPPRRTSRRKAPPSAEQDMYYGGAGAMSSEGHGGEYGYASAYDEGGYGADAYAQQQHQYYAQQPQTPYGQPGGIMQYPGQQPPAQATTYPPQLYSASSPTNSGGGIPYHHSTGSDGGAGAHSYDAHPNPNQQEQLRGPSPPTALVPGTVGSPAPSHRSIPQLGAMQFEQHEPMPMPGSQGHEQPLRVVNDDDPYGGMDDAAAYHYQQQQYGQGYGQR